MEIFNKQPGFIVIRWNRSPGNDPTVVVYTTVDGKNPANQLRLVVYPIIYGNIYPWWCRISSINSITDI